MGLWSGRGLNYPIKTNDKKRNKNPHNIKFSTNASLMLHLLSGNKVQFKMEKSYSYIDNYMKDNPFQVNSRWWDIIQVGGGYINS